MDIRNILEALLAASVVLNVFLFLGWTWERRDARRFEKSARRAFAEQMEYTQTIFRQGEYFRAQYIALAEAQRKEALQ